MNIFTADFLSSLTILEYLLKVIKRATLVQTLILKLKKAVQILTYTDIYIFEVSTNPISFFFFLLKKKTK